MLSLEHYCEDIRRFLDNWPDHLPEDRLEMTRTYLKGVLPHLERQRRLKELLRDLIGLDDDEGL